MDKRRRGNVGEDAVCRYVEDLGYQIVERNYRKKCGELDIIAYDDDFLVIIEVKSRKYNGMTRGVDAITYTKMKRIIETTECYLRERKPNSYIRFDVADVTISNDDNPLVLDIKYYKNAFDGNSIDKKQYIY